MNTKKCSECCNTKPADLFDGVNTGCRECVDAMIASLSPADWEKLETMMQDQRRGLLVTYSDTFLGSLGPEFWRAFRYFSVAQALQDAEMHESKMQSIKAARNLRGS